MKKKKIFDITSLRLITSFISVSFAINEQELKTKNENKKSYENDMYTLTLISKLLFTLNDISYLI